MSTGHLVGSPAPRPCASCPYQRDVPSGIWALEEYEKLAAYDAPTAEQPASLFLCHQTDRESQRARVCAGWAGCHGGQLLALRLAMAMGTMSPEDVAATWDYESPVSLFESGSQAAEHGAAEIRAPGDRAMRAMRKIERVRGDLADAGDVS